MERDGNFDNILDEIKKTTIGTASFHPPENKMIIANKQAAMAPDLLSHFL
jgi:hypothetical protein